MLKDELINLNDDSFDTFTNFTSVKGNKGENDKADPIKLTKISEFTDFLNEEIDTRNLPASPPFTKVSSIKIYKTPLKTSTTVTSTLVTSKSNKSTPLKMKESVVEGVSVGKATNRRDPTKSFIPRIVKKRTQ